MLITKKIDLGEYIVEIEYDDETGAIEVTVLDELEGVIESITITNAQDEGSDTEEDDDEDGFNDFNFSPN
ncbi:MAG: hypothetical protein E6R13_07450 [Spirochaetes bacterium]|nr:MAG: hypothetical protein E6R13_07450 [Spirochaetota bacterium]